jgi:parallel beta-helix repeat protein
MSHARRVLLVLAIVLLAASNGTASASHSRVHTVRPGQSIQAALDAARPGDTVVVRPGTYREQPQVVKDRITLVGHGAVLSPPATPVPNRCSVAVGAPQNPPANPFGICVAGDISPGAPPPVHRPVRGVTVRGFTVSGFEETAITVIGGQGTRIEDNDVTGGLEYGILLSNSSGDVVSRNQVRGAVVAGIYVGDSPNSRATVTRNDVADNGVFGIFVRNASHGTVSRNSVRGSCSGIALIPPGPPAAVVADWTVTGNRITGNNRVCPSVNPQEAPLTGVGLLLSGATDITVTRNVIRDNRVGDARATWGGGVVLISGSLFGVPKDPTGILVAHNTLRGNAPFDIVAVDEGSANRYRHNRCALSSPTGLCSRR